MNTYEQKEAFEKLQAELKKLKESDPQKYLDLLKALNAGMEKISAEMDKALGK